MSKEIVPNLPIKPWVLGLTTYSFSDSSSCFYFANPNSFDSYVEARKFIEANKDWNQDGHPHCGLEEMSQEDREWYNNYYNNLAQNNGLEVFH